ncbi:MAG: heme o synthase [Myxococcota bacterium]|nr:heme o synthase [Myxococcota bacterium]
MSATTRSHNFARDLAALAKPSITMLSVFTMLAGVWLAPGEVNWSAISLAVIGTALVVAAANTLNCYIERDSDKFMARTKARPLPAGRMLPKTALFYGLALALISVPVLTFGVNPVTGLLAAIALVSYVWIYTPMKQISPWALWVGAVPGAMPPLLGWTAVQGQIEWPGLVLFGIMFIWQLPHFIAISMYRDQEYQRAGIRTVAAVNGWSSATKQIFFWTAVLVPFSFLLVPLNVTGYVYLVCSAALGAGFVWKAAKGFRSADQSKWARGIFLYSLIYLTLLFAAVAVDVLVGKLA